ncbi:MAG: hypothetical protein WC511_05030 [Candidatus Pacearchaeota archaeon]
MVNLRKSTLVGIFIGLIIFGILFYFLGQEWVIKYSPIIVVISFLLILIVMHIYGFLYNRFAWEREPEDNEKILNLNMNQSLSIIWALWGFALALILFAISPSFSFENVQIISLFAGLLFIFIGQIIYANEYLPRFKKLIIIAKNEEVLKKK